MIDRRRRFGFKMLCAGAALAMLVSCFAFTRISLEILGLSWWISMLYLGLMCAARQDWRGGVGCILAIGIGLSWQWWMPWMDDFVEAHINLGHAMNGVVGHAVLYAALLLVVFASPRSVRGVWGVIILIVGVGGAALVAWLTPPSFFGILEWVRAMYVVQFATSAAFGVETFLYLRSLEPKPGLCPACQYDIRSLTTPNCPECGLVIAARPG